MVAWINVSLVGGWLMTQKPARELMRIREVLERFPISRTRLFTLMRLGVIHRKYDGRSVYVVAATVREYLEALPDERPTGKATPKGG